MKEIKLFTDKQGKPVTNQDILRSLEKVEAHKSDILYIHTGMSFGVPNTEIPKSEFLQIILDTILQLKVPTICVPTFTFSFCNGKDFDVTNSKSKMGAINEYIRKHPDSIRSIDPLMSVALMGKEKDLARDIGHESIGKDSTFDKLHYKKGVRFLFLGTKIGDCFTYMHYMEKFLNVPYRYDKDFTGKIITPEKTYEDTYSLFVRYKNIFAGNGSYIYEDLMLENKVAKKDLIGDSFIISVEEAPAFEAYADLIKKDPNYFLTPDSIADLDKTFVLTKEMVAL